MGALRVRVMDDGIDVVFSAPAVTQEQAEVDVERELARRKQIEEDDLFRSAS
jgi:hypothetical protein